MSLILGRATEERAARSSFYPMDTSKLPSFSVREGDWKVIWRQPGWLGDEFVEVYRLRVLGQWFDGIRFYAAASSPTRSRRTWAGLR